MNWNDVENKEDVVYIPLLEAFINEINRAYDYGKHPEVPRNLVKFMIGQEDFYKIISLDDKHVTRLETYNLNGTLNKNGLKTGRTPQILVPLVDLPDRIISLQFMPDSKNTVEMYLNGWQFSFRIHNASTKIEPSLKFDVQIKSAPTTIIAIDCQWQTLQKQQ